MNDPLVKDSEFEGDEEYDAYDSFGARLREIERRLDLVFKHVFKPMDEMDPREVGGVVTTTGLRRK